jgi:hypothetical protein
MPDSDPNAQEHQPDIEPDSEDENESEPFIHSDTEPAREFVTGAGAPPQATPMGKGALETLVTAIINEQPVTDLHTHCYAPSFGSSPDSEGLLLWGIDELVTYHYLIAEVFRIVPSTQMDMHEFWYLPKQEQADHIWKHLFADRTPISEACRGVVTTLTKLGLDPHEKTLEPYRKWFAQQEPNAYIDKVMQIANVDSITMTNEVFDEHERHLWLHEPNLGDDSRFEAVLRIDKLITDWPGACNDLRDMGYQVRSDFSGDTAGEGKRFLEEWIDRIKAIYVASSLPPGFTYPTPVPQSNQSDRVIKEILMPVLQERNLPWAMMIGSKRGVNPQLQDAGDIGQKADVDSVANLCRHYPQNKFMCTMLSRENQHELAVVSRKFGNLLLFGCWWFLNNPSLIEEMTRMRMELLGSTFTPQHSDARILDQLIYKWDHSRQIIGKVLVDKYADLANSGYHVNEAQIRQDARLLLRDNFRNFLDR